MQVKLSDILSREQDIIAGHIQKYTGTAIRVFAPCVDEKVCHSDENVPPISILEIPPALDKKGKKSKPEFRDNRDGWTYITCGASLKEQILPGNAADWIIPRTEFMCYVKEQNILPVEALNLLSRLPFEKDTHLYWWHTVNFVEPLDENEETTQSAFLLLPPYFEDADFDNFTLYGDDVRFLMALPITEEERAFAAQYGGQALEEKLLTANSDFIFDPQRESVI